MKHVLILYYISNETKLDLDGKGSHLRGVKVCYKNWNTTKSNYKL